MKLKNIISAPAMPDPADIAYLLLIFIIIMSIIGTDNLTGIRLPSASSEEKAPRQAERLIVTETSFFVGVAECADTDSLTELIQQADDDGWIVVADRRCPMQRMKAALRVLEKCGKSKIAFMTE